MLKFFLFLILFNLYSENAIDLFNKGEEEFENKNFKNAIYYYKSALEKNKYYVPALFKIGKSYENLGDFKNAEIYYKKGLERDPNNIEILNQLGGLYIILNNYKEAEKYFDKALRVNPNNYDSLIGKGRIYFLNSDYYLAEKYFNQAFRIEPSNPEALLNLAEIYIKKGKIEKADNYISQAERLSPANYKIFALKANLYLKNKNFTDAKIYLEKAFNLNPNDKSISIQLSDVYINLKDWNKASQILEKSKKFFKDEPLFYYKLALIYMLSGKKDDALDNFKSAISKNINDDIANYLYENFLINNFPFYYSDRITEAEKHFKKAEKFFKDNQIYEAITEYRRGLQIFSENWQARYNLGLLYKKLNFLEKYLNELKIAIKLNPDNQNLKDKLEIAETFRYKRLSNKLKIDQSSIEKDSIGILILSFNPVENNYKHFGAGKVIADSINNHLRNFKRFKIYEKNENSFYTPVDKKIISETASSLNAQYYVYGNFVETENSLQVNFDLYSVDNDEIIKNFSSTASGKDKLFYVSKDIAQNLNKFFPVYGRVIDIIEQNLILNIGLEEGVKKGDKIKIYDFTESEGNILEKFKRKEVATAKILDVDEQISIAKVDNRYDIEKVSINNIVKLELGKK